MQTVGRHASHLFEQSVEAIVVIAGVAPELLLVLGGHCGHGDGSRGEVEEVVNHGQRDGIWQVDRKRGVASVALHRNGRLHNKWEAQKTTQAYLILSKLILSTLEIHWTF